LSSAESLIESPFVVQDAPGWSAVFKPHGMPTAPLRAGENGTLLAWFLALAPEAASVRGKKSVENGLIHRLDTPTEGLVLIAKDQSAYDALQESQNADLIRKTYRAICDPESRAELDRIVKGLPLAIESRFRAWGPGGREVRPVFPADRRYDAAGRDYRTVLVSAEFTEGEGVRCACELTRGYRHQVRAHLASIGLPIQGDDLYNRRYTGSDTGSLRILALSAVGLSFPDPITKAPITISLP